MTVDALIQVLEKSKHVGFLGPGPVEDHRLHAMYYADPLQNVAGRVLDIGSGGGVPALPLLVANQQLSMTLLDSMQKRCSFLQWALVELGLQDRSSVVCERVEYFAHKQENRGVFAAVTARSFGPPASTLECAAAFLEIGGVCVISEPPQRRQWPTEPLSRLGLVAEKIEGKVVVFRKETETPEQYPRPNKERTKNPLFEYE